MRSGSRSRWGARREVKKGVYGRRSRWAVQWEVTVGWDERGEVRVGGQSRSSKLRGQSGM